MKNQVLTIEQMLELEALSIDTSIASMFWFDDGIRIEQLIQCSSQDTIGVWTDQYGEKCIIPAFTLQDILDMLPQGFYLEQNTTSLDKKVFLQINKTAGGGYNIAYEQSWDEDGKLKIKMHGQQLNDSLLEAAFNMLKWCKQNNYI